MRKGKKRRHPTTGSYSESSSSADCSFFCLLAGGLRPLVAFFFGFYTGGNVPDRVSVRSLV